MEDNDSSAKVASAGSIVAGLLAAAGWYTWIGTLLTAPQHATWNATAPADVPRAPDGLKSGAYWAPGILQSFALVGLNVVNWEAVLDDGGLGGDGTPMAAKAWITFMLIIAFSALGGCIWILVQDGQQLALWRGAGVGCLLQNLLIFSGSVIFRASRRSGDHAV